MARTGRPISDNPSQHKVSLRLTEQEYNNLKKYAESNNLNMTSAVKLGIEMLLKQSNQ